MFLTRQSQQRHATPVRKKNNYTHVKYDLSKASIHWADGHTAYRKILWSHEAAGLDFTMIVSLLNLTDISAALLSNFRALEKSKPESRGFETSRDLAVRRPSA